MSLAVRDEALVELMDDPHCDVDRLQATLRRFDTINRLVSGWGTLYRRVLGPHLASLGRPARVLDLGCGGGDLVMRLAGWARRDGLDVEWVGADPDPRAHEVARARPAQADVEFRRADAAALLSAGEVFDVVLSNHVLHHLGADLTAFADESLDLSRGIVLHSDIARGRLAYGLYAVGITPFAPGTFLRTDGLRSIRRSFTPTELDAALATPFESSLSVTARPWRVSSPSAFRVVAQGVGRG